MANVVNDLSKTTDAFFECSSHRVANITRGKINFFGWEFRQKRDKKKRDSKLKEKNFVIFYLKNRYIRCINNTIPICSSNIHSESKFAITSNRYNECVFSSLRMILRLIFLCLYLNTLSFFCKETHFRALEDEKSAVVNPLNIIRFKGRRTLLGERICRVDHQSFSQSRTLTVFFYCRVNVRIILHVVEIFNNRSFSCLIKIYINNNYTINTIRQRRY